MSFNSRTNLWYPFSKFPEEISFILVPTTSKRSSLRWLSSFKNTRISVWFFAGFGMASKRLSVSIASDKFTAPSDGKYFFTAAAKINDSSSSPTLVGSGMRFTINGAIAAQEIHFMANGSNKAEGKSVTAVLNLTASQYVEVYAYAQDNGGSACSITGGTDRDTFFMGFKLIT